MSEELDRIKKMAGLEPATIAEKVELNAAASVEEVPFSHKDHVENVKKTKLKASIEEPGATNLKGAITAVATGDLTLDDGKISEAKFGILKTLDESSAEKKAGRKAAGSYGRPGSKAQKQAASKSSRKSGKNDIKDQKVDEDRDFSKHSDKTLANMISQFNRDGTAVPRDLQNEFTKRENNAVHESIMFSKGSLERDMVEMIFDEMKLGKNATEISESLSFSLNDVESVYNHIKKKVNEGYTVLPPITDQEKERYVNREHEGLEGPFRLRSGKFVYYDKKAGKYYDSDTDLYISDEDYFAHDKPSDSIAESEPNDDAVKYGVEYGRKYLESEEALVILSDLRSGLLDANEAAGAEHDLMQNLEGNITNGLSGAEMNATEGDVKQAMDIVIGKYI